MNFTIQISLEDYKISVNHGWNLDGIELFSCNNSILNMVTEFKYFNILNPLAPSELLLLPSAKKSVQKGRIGMAGYQVTLKGLVEFQNKKF